MTDFTAVSGVVQGAMCLWALFLMLLFCRNLIRRMQQHRGKGNLLLSAALFAGNYLLMQVLLNLAAGKTIPGLSSPFPTWLALALLVLFSLGVVLLRFDVRRWDRTHVTPMSVRQSMDHLPVALCYSWAGGLPKLVNRKMELLCRAITGASLLNGDAFWNDLCIGWVQPDCQSIQIGTKPIIRLPDGSVYSFRRRLLLLEDHQIFELVAVNVTAEYAVSEELREKQAQAKQVNLRLRELNRTITAMTVEKETLAAKTRLHDELGMTLLAARRYLSQPHSVDRSELMARWQRVNLILKNEGPNALQEAYIDVVRSAYLLGVEIEIDGILPEVAPMRDLAVLAMNTCLTNTLRHAVGKKMFIRCENSGDAYRICIQNDGKTPENPVTEGGGLGNLRRRVEGAGGTMAVTSLPRFALTIVLPKEGFNHG